MVRITQPASQLGARAPPSIWWPPWATPCHQHASDFYDAGAARLRRSPYRQRRREPWVIHRHPVRASAASPRVTWVIRRNMTIITSSAFRRRGAQPRQHRCLARRHQRHAGAAASATAVMTGAASTGSGVHIPQRRGRCWAAATVSRHWPPSLPACCCLPWCSQRAGHPGDAANATSEHGVGNVTAVTPVPPAGWPCPGTRHTLAPSLSALRGRRQRRGITLWPRRRRAALAASTTTRWLRPARPARSGFDVTPAPRSPGSGTLGRSAFSTAPRCWDGRRQRGRGAPGHAGPAWVGGQHPRRVFGVTRSTWG